MPPSPQENVNVKHCANKATHEELTGNEVVISGISGTFPKSENVFEFMENLFNKENMVSDTGFDSQYKHPELPKHLGKIKKINKFDAQFFKVNYLQASAMNPAGKLLLEHTYRAIFDAGMSPVLLNGSKIGVFVGASYSDSMLTMYDKKNNNDFLLSGYSMTMLANRISYWINAKGPSYFLDQNDTNAMACLQLAYRSIKSGECDSAIIGVYNCCLDPRLSVSLKRYGLLCSDGKTKCFDKKGDGYVRADTVAVIFLQKAKDAKRIYSEVVHIKGQYFVDPDQKLTHSRKSQDIEAFLEEFYSQIKVSPRDIEYIEANATGHAKYDAEELESIGNFFGKYKQIKVGSVKSNMGHAEGASGACALIKACLSYYNGMLPANLHYTEPLDIPAVKNGRVEILKEKSNLNRTGYTAINSFSYTGFNWHTLLKGHYKETVYEKASIPHLILASGRKEESVDIIFDFLENNPINVEQIALLRSFFEHDILWHTGRGYIILESGDNIQTQNLGRSVDYYPGQKRSVWFLYSGMGSQWTGMGKQLLGIPMFAKAIEKCQRILQPKGIDLFNILASEDKSILKNVLNCFVAISAVQIGLTDILKSMGIVPDNIIGHSLGELGCAYADGCLSMEEMILAAYYRGLVSAETKFTRGSMAAIGLGYNNISKILPPEVEVACHNSSESCTISGPANEINEFVTELNSRGIFAKHVESANIAYHSKYIKAAGPDLLKYMGEVIKNPKRRSSKWLSTSVPYDKWNDAKYASAEYITNNLLNYVYFEEAARMIPENAIVIEIAPHGLLQAIVKRSHAQCLHVPLTSRTSQDSVLFLLNSIGKLYEAGLNPKIDVMYPEVTFPVKTNTPMLSHLVGWEHSETWSCYSYNPDEVINYVGRKFVISLYDDDYKYIEGHVINGVYIFPQAAILVLVWETLATYHGIDYRHMSVVFQNLQFHSNVIIEKEEPIRLNIEIQKGCQRFEVIHNNFLVTSGIIRTVSHVEPWANFNIENDNVYVNGLDLYRMMQSKGYLYKGDFQSIQSLNVSSTKAYVHWNNNWVALLDALIQMNAFSRTHDGVSTPKFINKLTIDVKKHQNIEYVVIDDYNCYYAEFSELYGVTKCGGITIKDIVFTDEVKTGYNFVLSNRNEIIHNSLLPQFKLPQKSINEHIILSSKANGDIDRLYWTEGTEQCMNTHNLVKVCYAGVSLKDCLKALGNTTNDHNSYGMDYSGIDKNGKYVMGIVNGGALSNYVTTDEELTWPVPEHWSLEDAATVPMPYLHAYYCLTIRCNIMPNYTVLITSATGALGQAMVSLCLSLHCTVFATVSSVEKKILLLKLFPKLNEHHISYSRHESFSNFILSFSNKRCDIVVNCSSGELRKSAMKCVAPFGVLLDISDRDVKNNEPYGMHYNVNSKNYISVRLNHLFEKNYTRDKKLLHRSITEGIAKGVVKPLSRVVYSPADVTRAFRLKSSSGHMGRVLVNMSEIQSVHTSSKLAKRFICTPSDVQIIFCGENGLGIELADHLILSGAKRICLVVDSNSMTSYLQVKLRIWKNNNIEVELISQNIKYSNHGHVIERAFNIGKSGGIYIFLDKNLVNDSIETTTKFISDLDQASRNQENLRYFVIISSITSEIEGKLSYIEKLCDERNALKLHALLLHIKFMQNDLSKMTTLFKALEMSLNLNYNNLTVQQITSNDLLSCLQRRLLRIFGLRHLENIDKTLTMGMLKLSESNLDEIKTAIKEYSHVEYSTNDIKNMSFASLEQICNQRNKERTKKGMGVFYNYINNDEIEASEPITVMPTILSQTVQKIEDLDREDTYLLMIPGFNGEHQIFVSVAERLKVKALTLNLVADCNNDSIENIAAFLVKSVKKRIKIKSKFYILGYSFGVLVALELAAILEKEGHVGIIYCLDSSPDALKIQLDAYLGKLTYAELQNEVIENMYYVITGDNSEEIKKNLKEADVWGDKKLLLISKVHEHFGISNEYLDSCLETLYRRILLAYEYSPSYLLDSELVLLKGIPHSEEKDFSEDFGLFKYTTKPVKVFKIESEHAMAPFDCRVPNIVNKMLDPGLLKEFEKKYKGDFYYSQKHE